MSRHKLSEKAMAAHSSTLTWKIPWMEEPGGPQSMGSLRVRHDWAASLSLFLSCFGEGNGNPLQCSCLENPRDRGAWWAAVCGVAQSQTRLKRLSSSGKHKLWASQVAQCKQSTCQCRRCRFDPWVRKIPWRRKWLTHSSILAWEIPWTKEPDGLQSVGVAKSQTQLSD